MLFVFLWNVRFTDLPNTLDYKRRFTIIGIKYLLKGKESMIYNNVELHNVEELQPAPGGNGVVLNRFPSRVTEALKGSLKQWCMIYP